MKVRTALPALALAALAVVAAPLLAQAGPGARGQCGRQGGGSPAYDLTTETTVSGTVAEVLPQTCPQAGIHLRLATASGDLEIGLGPSAFLSELGVGFAAGDEIRVTGAVPRGAALADFVARSVTKGDATYELRDTEGKPRWAAGRSCAMRGRQGAGETG